MLPEWALSPERQAFAQAEDFNHHLVHATKGQEVENLEELTIDAISECDDKFATYSEDFIKKMAKSDKPFFLYHCTRGTHVKNYPNPKFKGKSPAKYPYKDCIMEMDDVLGRLVKALDDTGQLENTLIFVTLGQRPDDGALARCRLYAVPRRHRLDLGRRRAGPGRRLLEGHDQARPGAADGLFDLADLFTTSAALAGVQYRPPEDQYLDGIDQTSFLLADAGLSNRKYEYFWLQDDLSGLRVAEYKFMLAGTSWDEYGRRQRRVCNRARDLPDPQALQPVPGH